MRGRPPWILCLNMECPAKNGKGKRKGTKAAAGKGKARRKTTKKEEPAAPDLPAG